MRGHLERTRGRKRATAPTAGRTTGVSRARALIENASLDPSEIERALVLGLLEDEFGPDIANDAKFQSVVDDVVALLRTEPDMRATLAEAVKRLRDAPLNSGSM
ncbi:MAG: hypothetical protein QM759_04940 [Terricaulis sp.]